MNSANKERAFVEYPLEPQKLIELGIIDILQETPIDFNPIKSWCNTYRIWADYGFVGRNDMEVGFLRIEYHPQNTSYCVLKIKQEMVDAPKFVNRLEAKAICEFKDLLLVPVEWQLSSEMVSPERKIMKELSFKQIGHFKDNILVTETNGKLSRIKTKSPVTFNWASIGAIQQLEFQSNLCIRFQLLEELLVFKPDQTLRYGGEYYIGDTKIPLHRFYQIGESNLPFEYYVDTHHRVQIIISMNRVYILDDNAEKKTLSLLSQKSVSE